MSSVRLTDSQGKAVEAKHHVSVVAAAGSGKTRVLVERYLQLLRRDPARRPREILAITFTNRAAAEMRQRIRVRLRTIAAEAQDSEAQTQAQACLDEFHSAAVTTIHGFANEILRNHPFEADLDPGYAVGDATVSVQARQDAVDAVLQDIFAEPGRHGLREAARTALRALGARARDSLTQIVSRDLLSSETLRDIADSHPDLVLDRTRDLWEREVRPPFDGILADARTVQHLRDAQRLVLSGFQGPQSAPIAGLPRAVEIILDTSLPMSVRGEAVSAIIPLFLTDGSPRRALTSQAHGAKADWADGAQREELKEVIRDLGAPIAALNEVWIPWSEGREKAAAPLGVAMAALAHAAREDLSRRKDGEGWLDFSDQLIGAAHLVEREPERVARSVAGRFRGILIDEFQDTDPLQWRLVQALISAVGPDTIPVMLVGDPRQSIYRFRNADVRLFAEAQRELAALSSPDEFTPVEMNDNFRSTPALVQIVNSLLGDLIADLGDDQEAPMPTPTIRPRCSHADWPSVVHLLPVPRGDARTLPVELEAESVAIAISALKSSPRGWSEEFWESAPPADFSPDYGDIAVLLRATTHLSAFEAAFRRREIPYTVGGGGGLTERQEIWDLAHLIRFLAEPTDDRALLGLLRTPWIGWSDDLVMKTTALTCGLRPPAAMPLWDRVTAAERLERDGVAFTDAEWAHVMRTRDLLKSSLAQCLHATAAEVAERLLTATGAWALVRMETDGARRLANLRRGLSRLRRRSARGIDSVLTAAEELKRLVADGARESEEPLSAPGESAVSIMTVHAAKGLEFPIVILPGLHTPHQRRERQGDWMPSPEAGIAMRAPDPGDGWKLGRSAAMEIACRREERESLAEEMRLLYVALTRAERMVIVSGIVNDALEKATRGAAASSTLSWILRGLRVGEGDLALPRISPPWEDMPSIPVLSPERCRHLAPDESTSGEPPPPLEITAEIVDATDPLPLRHDSSRPLAITALSLFAECPNRHFLEREGGNPEVSWFTPSADGERPKTHDSDASVLGLLYHRIAERLLSGDSGGDARSVAEEHFREIGVPFDSELSGRAEALWSQFRQMDLWQRLQRAETRLTELEVLIDHVDGPLRGRLDLVAQIDGQWEIIDHKTSSQPGDDADLLARHRVQMECYLLFLHAHAPEQPTHTTRLAFPALRREVSLNVEASEIPAIRDQIGDLIRRFKTERGKLHPVHPHGACATCPFDALPICHSLASRDRAV